MSETPPKAAGFPATTVLAVLALLYTLYFARDFLIPITFAVLLNFLLSPAVRAMGRLRIPPPIAAALVVLSLIGAAALAVYELSGPVQGWVDRAPESLSRAQRELRKITRPIERVSRTAEEVQNATGAGGVSKPPEVVVRGETMASRIFGSTQRLLAKLTEVILLLYFLLAAGDLFLRKLIKVLPHLGDKLKAVRIARETEASISTYLLTNAAINGLEGVMVGLAMWLLGMPNPVLWGSLAAALEFIPYLGALVMAATLSVAALATFTTLGHALLVPGAFLLANLIQANIISPLLLGHRLSLNPVALFVGLAFWFWIWGIPGAFIGVPLLAVFKICCDHIESLAPIGRFLGGKDEDEAPARLPEDPLAT